MYPRNISLGQHLKVDAGEGMLLVVSRCCVLLRMALCLPRARPYAEQFAQKGNRLDRKKCAHRAPGLHPFNSELRRWGWGGGIFVCLGCQNNYPRLGSLNNRNQFSYSSGAWKSKIKVPLAFSLCPHVVFPL